MQVVRREGCVCPFWSLPCYSSSTASRPPGSSIPSTGARPKITKSMNVRELAQEGRSLSRQGLQMAELALAIVTPAATTFRQSRRSRRQARDERREFLNGKPTPVLPELLGYIAEWTAPVRPLVPVDASFASAEVFSDREAHRLHRYRNRADRSLRCEMARCA